MKRILMIVGIVAMSTILVSCERPYDWESAPLTHVCTDQQMRKAEQEAAWCDENTSYFSTYCYGSAIIRNCEEADRKEEKK